MKIIKFKFCSRKSIYGKSNGQGVELSGWAYYIIDNKGIIIAQIPQIIKGEYRVTDSDMIATRGYWRKRNIKEFREKFLFESEPNKYTKKSPRKQLTKNQIKEINIEFLKNKFSFLTALSLLSGSNITGCDTDKLRQPYFYVGEDIEDEWNLFNPINCFKSIRKNKKIEIDITKSDKYITLKEYFNLFENIEIHKNKYNPKKLFINWNHLRKIMTEASNEVINSINFEIQDTKTIIKKTKFSLDDYLEDGEEKLRLYLNNEFNSDYSKLKNFVRSRFSIACNLAIEKNLLSPSSFEDDNPIICENAHIIPVQYLLQNRTDIKSLLDAISPYNCLRLSPNLHTLYDKNLITFTPDGRIEGKISIGELISKDIQNHNLRKKYIEKNYKNWLIHQKNL